MKNKRKRGIVYKSVNKEEVFFLAIENTIVTLVVGFLVIGSLGLAGYGALYVLIEMWEISPLLPISLIGILISVFLVGLRMAYEEVTSKEQDQEESEDIYEEITDESFLETESNICVSRK